MVLLFRHCCHDRGSRIDQNADSRRRKRRVSGYDMAAMAASRFEALLQIADTIAGARDLQELLRLLAPTLREAVDFDYVAVFLHDPEKNLMNLHMIERFFDGPTPTSSIPTEQSPSGFCFLTQQPLIIENVDTEKRFARDVIAILK